MRLGIAVHGASVANRFDFADKIRMYEISDQKAVFDRDVRLARINPLYDANAVLSAGIDALICGAINCFTFRMLAGNGIQVMPWVSGSADAVLQSYMKGTLGASQAMRPGFGMGAARRFHGKGKRCRWGRGFDRRRAF